MSTKYMIEVIGANQSSTRIGPWGSGVHAHTHMQTGWCPATVYEQEGERAPYWDENGEHRRVALYSSREVAALAVSSGELWNGQAFRIRPARGVNLQEGVLIK